MTASRAGGARDPLRAALLGLLGVAVVALAVGAVWALSAAPYDDAYIHLRIARHLVERGEPYFNAGERVMAGSSPLWLVLLAASVRLLGPGPAPWLPLLEAAILVGLLLAVTRFLRATTDASRALSFAAALPVVALALPSAGGLMESPLALLLLVLAATAIARGRPALAGLAAAFAVTARFELAVAAAAGLLLVPGARARVRYLLAALPVAAAEVALLGLAYGTPFPSAANAKAIVYQLEWSEFLGQLWPSPRWRMIAAWVAVAAAAALAMRAALPRRAGGATAPPSDADRARAFLGATSLTLLAAFAAKRAFIFPWYWVHALGPAGVAAASLVLDTQVASMRRRAVAAVAAAAWLFGAGRLLRDGLVDAALAVRGVPAASPRVAESLRTVSLARIGRTLAAACPGAVVMAPEIGALGLAYPGKVLDAVGLASPEVLRFHPLRVPEERPNHFVGAVPVPAVEEFRPDAIVSVEIFMRDFLARRERTPGLAEYRIRHWPIADPDAPAGMPERIFESGSIVVAVRGACDPGEPPRPAGVTAAASTAGPSR